MALYDRFERVAAGIQSTLYADDWMLLPRTLAASGDVNAPLRSDPDRAGGIIWAIFSDKPEDFQKTDAYDTRTDQRPGMRTSAPMLEIDPYYQPEGAPADIRQGDIVQSIKDGSRWRLGPGVADEMGRTQYRLSKVKPA